MNKTTVNILISNLKKANMVTKVLPWMVEGQGDQQLDVRYVGLKLQDDWLDILSKQDNLMLKFNINKKTALLETYLANKPPFIRLKSSPFTKDSKWEGLLGNLKNKLKKDKEAYIHHQVSVDNLYAKIIKDLK